MSSNSLFDQVAARAQTRFESMMAGNDHNPFSVAYSAVFDTLGELAAVDYARLLVDQPQLLDVCFVTKEVPVERFTVRRMLGDAFIAELEKRISFDSLDRAVIEKHAGREPPPHMAENFATALAATAHPIK